jgi:hypothetical protein
MAEQLFCADGQMEVMKLTVTFNNPADALKIGIMMQVSDIHRESEN